MVRLALAGFDVGVDVVQLAIVAVLFPIAFAFRDTWAYRRVAFIVGSVAIATVCLVERTCDIQLVAAGGTLP